MRSEHCVEVGRHQGRTAIFVDGKPIPGLMYHGCLTMSDESRSVFVREAAETGMQAFSVMWHFHKWEDYNAAAGSDIFIGRLRDREDAVLPWAGPGLYDFSLFDFWAKRLCDFSPEAWLTPVLILDTPQWWAEAHPEELVRYSDGPGRSPLAVQGSMASEVWISDVSEVLRAFVDHVENGPWANRILGYMLNSGGTQEWVYWGAQQGQVADYSAPALRYYRDWLRKKYGDQSWIDTAEIPTEAQRRRGQPGLLRDPSCDRAAIDFDMCLSDMLADNLLRWCGVVKEATRRKRLTGSYFSYLLWQTGLINPAVANGHIGLRKVLESPDIDFVIGLTSYDNREPGGPGSFMLPVESIQRAGKLFFNEADVRTHLTPHSSSLRYFGTGLLNLWPLQDAQESVDVIRREFAHNLIHGAVWWYVDMSSGGGWFSCPEILGEFRKQNQIAQDALDWDMSSVAEVAGLISGAGAARHPFLRMHDVNNYPRLLEMQCDRATRELYRAGLPIDWWMMEDLEQGALDRYKVLFFYNATWLSQSQREAVEALKGNGRVLIFVGYPGLARDGELDAESASSLVGMRLQLENRREPAELTPRDYEDPCLREIKAKLTLGSGALIGPRLLPTDDNAAVIACWPDGSPASAVKRNADWTSFFFPVSPNNADLFRAICRNAGCHIYNSNGDVVFANRALLSVHFVDCIQPLDLPHPQRVVNLFTGQTVLEKGARFMPTGDGGTHLYRLFDVETCSKT